MYLSPPGSSQFTYQVIYLESYLIICDVVLLHHCENGGGEDNWTLFFGAGEWEQLLNVVNLLEIKSK